MYCIPRLTCPFLVVLGLGMTQEGMFSWAHVSAFLCHAGQEVTRRGTRIPPPVTCVHVPHLGRYLRIRVSLDV